MRRGFLFPAFRDDQHRTVEVEADDGGAAPGQAEGDVTGATAQINRSFENFWQGRYLMVRGGDTILIIET